MATAASKAVKKTAAPAKKASATAPVKTVARTSQKPVAAKKTASKTSAKSTPKVSVPAAKSSVENKTSSSKLRKSQVVLALVIVLLGTALYFGRSLFVAAVVNGQPISRLAVVQEAEKQTGKQTLNNLVRNALIEQEAKKQNVTVSDQEINDEVKKLDGNLSKQGQKLDQVLAVQGMTRSDLNRLIRLDKLVSKMVGKDVKVSDKEVDDYIAKNKDLLPQDQDEKTLKQQVKDRLTQQKTTDKVKSWLEDIQAKAKVIYFVQY